MPLSKYNAYFGGNAAKALRAMIAKYGAQRGRQIFYATVQKHKKRR
jgi:hypothetical protein